MRELNGREKFLGSAVLVFGLLFGWWQISRNMTRQIALLEADIGGVNDRIRQTNSTVAQLNATLAGPANSATAATPVVPQSGNSLTILRELTMPSESQNLKVISVSRTDATGFAIQVEGRFGEMMRFISYLERADSRIQVGNVGLSRQPESAIEGVSGVVVRNIRGNITISLRG